MGEFFSRTEKKYLINESEYVAIKEKIKDKMVEDEHGESLICNLYFDDDSYDLIRTSIEKPKYKDKIRIRSYNVPTENSTVFFEIKRKCLGVVTKRRIKLKLSQINNYLSDKKDSIENSQIAKEIDYYFKFYNLKPKVYLSYSRKAYYAKNDKSFRITFDKDITARDYDLDLTKGSYGEKVLEKGKYLMEVKTLVAIPLWFVEIISTLKIYPRSFSKYGTYYKNELVEMQQKV